MTPRQQLIWGLGAIVLLVMVLELVRRRRLREEHTVFWLLTCAVLLSLAIWRRALNVVAQIVGTTLPLSALFGVGFFLVLLIMLHFSTVVSSLWQQSKQMAKEIGLLEEALRELKHEIHGGTPSSAKGHAGDADPDPESSLRN